MGEWRGCSSLRAALRNTARPSRWRQEHRRRPERTEGIISNSDARWRGWWHSDARHNEGRTRTPCQTRSPNGPRRGPRRVFAVLRDSRRIELVCYGLIALIGLVMLAGALREA